jgi:hypothetical protein
MKKYRESGYVLKIFLVKNILPILVFSISVLMIASAPNLFLQNHSVTTNQIHPDASHIDKISSQSHKPSLTPTVMAGLHLPFIKNVGQSDSKVKFYANTFAGTMFVTNDGLTYSVPDPSISKVEKFSTMEQNRTYSVIQENFENVGPLQVTGQDKSITGVSYFKGKNKHDWYTSIPTYDTITLGTVWSGVNLDLKAHGNNVEKIFTVNPGANVKNIKINISGAKNLTVSNGQLLINNTKGTLSMTKPLAYQDIDGTRKTVDVSYTVSGTTYGFDIGRYDKSHPVMIDPLLASTYLGGNGDDDGTAIALDTSGNVYITGFASSTNFPGTAGGAQSSHGSDSGSYDVFVSKLNGALTTLTQSTYLGGNNDDEGNAIALDTSGNVYITGLTRSTDFPGTAGGAQSSHASDSNSCDTSNDGTNIIYLSPLKLLVI